MLHNTYTTTTKAAVVREVGDAHALKVENDFPTPELKAGGVIVRINMPELTSLIRTTAKDFILEIFHSLVDKREVELSRLCLMKLLRRESKLEIQ